ncbi:MAG: alpha/beta fold hydrolase [Beijerinckiaceae bacterium]|nr:alpha/beta fold hydrolase [Beijerinckiaceae bacterium]
MFATTRDGTKIFYKLSGQTGSTRRVALLHSLAMDHTFWAPIAERLKGEAAILTIDCRGHGKSDKPAGPYTVELFADDLADVFDQIGWDKAVVSGASMGGCVSLAFATRYPQRVTGLGLFDTTACYGAPAPWEERAQKALAEGLASLTTFQQTRWFSDKFRADNPHVVQAAVDVFLANELPPYAETCRMLGSADLRAALPSIKVPARIIVGSEDYATPVDMAKTMHEGIAGSTMEIIEGARHLSPLEIPDKIADELRVLLGE